MAGRRSGDRPFRGPATRLAVATTPVDANSTALLDRLLTALGAAANSTGGSQCLRIAMLESSLRLVAGRSVAAVGTSHDVIDLAVAGITARTCLQVAVEGRPAFPVRAPAAAALVLVQLAVNAERHTRASSVTLIPDTDAFHVAWPGVAAETRVVTARRRFDRGRWGLGFCKIAADTLGGAVYAPADRGDGTVVATLDLGLRELSLPVAAVRGGRVLKATRTWDEETGCPPGAPVPPGSRLARCLEAAPEAGDIACAGGWAVRSVGDRCWVAIPPDDVLDRARDVLDGMAHERALWDGMPEPHATRVFALAALCATRLGSPLPRVPVGAWNQRMASLAPALRLLIEVPRLNGLGALDPRIVAYLASELGEELLTDGEDLMLRIRPGYEDDEHFADLARVGDWVRLN